MIYAFSLWAKVNRIDFHYELLLFLWHRSTSLIYFLFVLAARRSHV